MDTVDNILEEYKLKLGALKPEDVQFEKDLMIIQEKDGRTDSLYNIGKEFSVVHLNINSVLQNLKPDENALALKADEIVIDQDMMHQIDFIEAGVKLMPPLLYTIGESLAIFDGKQQVSLCRHLGHETMPFLVRNLAVDKVQGLLKKR